MVGGTWMQPQKDFVLNFKTNLIVAVEFESCSQILISTARHTYTYMGCVCACVCVCVHVCGENVLWSFSLNGRVCVQLLPAFW